MIWAADLAFSQWGGKSEVSFAAPPPQAPSKLREVNAKGFFCPLALQMMT